MTKEEFAEVMPLIDGAYGFSTGDEKRDQLKIDVWFKYFNGFEKRIFERVVNEYIVENPKPPTISDLYGRCKRLTELGL